MREGLLRVDPGVVGVAALVVEGRRDVVGVVVRTPDRVRSVGLPAVIEGLRPLGVTDRDGVTGRDDVAGRDGVTGRDATEVRADLGVVGFDSEGRGVVGVVGREVDARVGSDSCISASVPQLAQDRRGVEGREAGDRLVGVRGRTGGRDSPHWQQKLSHAWKGLPHAHLTSVLEMSQGTTPGSPGRRKQLREELLPRPWPSESKRCRCTPV
mmetsp:Transcript_29583/g.78285  ORF Transcript_29583/g.78285 Transcript_29583/m.78285 type:complete len:211 (-) Transcript_29583:495-1127(-)